MKEENGGWVRTISLTPPTLKDNTADTDRLLNALKTQLKTKTLDADLPLLKKLPKLLREFHYSVKCILFKDQNRWSLLDIKNSETNEPVAGIAVDLGTTRVVLRLIDMTNGRPMGETAFDNPQIEIGPDVLMRIHYADKPGGLEHLNRLIIEGLGGEIEKLCGRCGIQTTDIYVMALAGNTTMTHLFMGLEPRWIIREPYIPVINRPPLYLAEELGIHLHPRARMLIFPNVGSYFGGDLISGILYSGLSKTEETAILVDVGTNAEVVVGNKHWLIACAGAAGPALEGGVTKMGMMAGPGVIDTVVIDPHTREFSFKTIENQPPKGICGSGLIDLAAQLFLSGMIDFRGRLQAGKCGPRYLERDGVRHIVVVPKEEAFSGEDLLISQVDLDSLIRSKAAMYTILETITATVGLNLTEIEKFYVAGTFGSFIKPKSAISIGMIPDLPLERYIALGNSSLGGASLVLTTPAAVDEIDEIRDRITYLELNVNQEFMNRFSAAKFLPHTETSLFPTVKLSS